MSSGQSSHFSSRRHTEQLNLNHLAVPSHTCHIKAGSVLCTNDEVLLLQDGSTTIEFRLPPQFQAKKIPWRHGLIRDIAWCEELRVFILLTKDALFKISPRSLFEQDATMNRPLPDFTVHKYSEVKPYNKKDLFWRCTCVGTMLYIIYWGQGTVMEEYELEGSSCILTNRLFPPQTCARYEGIWCIRYHPETGQFGFSIVDYRNNEWRIEVRSRDRLATLWKLALPIWIGDVELSPVPNGEWLAINSVGLRLIEVANKKLKAIVDYNRELRNAIVMDYRYFIVRTKSTLEIQRIKGSR